LLRILFGLEGDVARRSYTYFPFQVCHGSMSDEPTIQGAP
jgi:hypothetical protein